MTFYLYDSSGNLAQTSSAFTINFDPNVIQSPVLTFTPATYGMSSLLTLNFTTNVNYAAGSFFQITTPIDFSKDTSLTCTANLSSASPSCSNSAGSLP